MSRGIFFSLIWYLDILKFHCINFIKRKELYSNFWRIMRAHSFIQLKIPPIFKITHIVVQEPERARLLFVPPHSHAHSALDSQLAPSCLLDSHPGRVNARRLWRSGWQRGVQQYDILNQSPNHHFYIYVDGLKKETRGFHYFFLC